MDLRQRSAQALEEERKRSKNLQEKNGGKKQRAANFTFAAPGLYPPPGTSPITRLLVERVEGQDGRFSVRARTQWVDANHAIFLGAEGANTGLVRH